MQPTSRKLIVQQIQQLCATPPSQLDQSAQDKIREGTLMLTAAIGEYQHLQPIDTPKGLKAQSFSDLSQAKSELQQFHEERLKLERRLRQRTQSITFQIQALTELFKKYKTEHQACQLKLERIGQENDDVHKVMSIFQAAVKRHWRPKAFQKIVVVRVDDFFVAENRGNFRRHEYKGYIATTIFKGHTAAVDKIQIVQRNVYSGSQDFTLKMWSWRGHCLRTLEHSRPVVSFTVCAGKDVFSLERGKVTVWDMRQLLMNEYVAQKALQQEFCSSIRTLSRNTVVVTYENGSIAVVTLKGKELAETRIAGQGKRVVGVAIEKAFFLTIDQEGLLRKWDSLTFECLLSKHLYRQVNFASQCLSVLVCYSKGKLMVVDRKGGLREGRYVNEQDFNLICFDERRGVAVMANQDLTVRHCAEED